MNRLVVCDTPIAGVKLVRRTAHTDERGFLSRIFCQEELQTAGWQGSIAQINHSATRLQGTLRGLHYQRDPHQEMKLVTCVRGRVWDVVLDVRPESPSFLAWFAAELSAANREAMLIPAGFAHGFQALCDDVELLYCHSEPHVPASEAGIDALDPRLAIPWPLPVALRSERDAALAPALQCLSEG